MLATVRFLLTARCRDTTRILSDEREQPASRTNWWASRLHFLSCGACRRFNKQLQLLDRLLKSAPPEVRERLAAIDTTTGLSEEAATRIETALVSARSMDS